MEQQIRRALRIAVEEPAELSARRDTVDFSRITPTRLPEALRDASQRALGHATDPLNQLDYNPYIADEWAVVAAELQSFATLLERRLGALFDDKYPRTGSTRFQSNSRNRYAVAMSRTPTSLVDRRAA